MIRIFKNNNIPTIYVHGEMSGHSNSLEVTNAIKELIENGYEGRIEIDLSNATLIDSINLGMLVLTYKRYDTDKNDIIIVNPKGMVYRVLHESNLYKVLKIIEK